MTSDLLGGTLLLRPYVFIFLVAFLAMAWRDLGGRPALGWLCLGFGVAFAAEYASTRIGFPFGLYHYTGATAGRPSWPMPRGASRGCAWAAAASGWSRFRPCS